MLFSWVTKSLAWLAGLCTFVDSSPCASAGEEAGALPASQVSTGRRRCHLSGPETSRKEARAHVIALRRRDRRETISLITFVLKNRCIWSFHGYRGQVVHQQQVPEFSSIFLEIFCLTTKSTAHNIVFRLCHILGRYILGLFQVLPKYRTATLSFTPAWVSWQEYTCMHLTVTF